MSPHHVFFSIVIVVRDHARQVPQLLRDTVELLSSMAAEFEVVVVDNASTDDSVQQVRACVGEGGLPNVQLYALTKRVDFGTAAWAGVESSLGDYVAVIDPTRDNLTPLRSLTDEILSSGADIAVARNRHVDRRRRGSHAFNRLYRSFTGIDLAKEAPPYRILSKRAINYLLQHPQPAITYRHLPADGGFNVARIEYEGSPLLPANDESTLAAVNRSIDLLVTTTRAPMRVITALSLLGAVGNVLYSIYVVMVAIFVKDVEPGWTSLSLQQSGMFFLISLVLLVLGEYMLNTTRSIASGPAYHIGHELASARVTRMERLNIEEARESDPAMPADPPADGAAASDQPRHQS